MSERAAFINAILDNPADDTARLVFADWLEEHGEPERAEFIRVQIEAAQLPDEDPQRTELDTRWRALLAERGLTWRRAVGISSEYTLDYIRGFIDGMCIFPYYNRRQMEYVLTVEPAAFNLFLYTCTEDDRPRTLDHIDALVTSPTLRATTRIWVEGRDDQEFGSEPFTRVLGSPHLVNLREISITRDVIGLEAVRAIAGSSAPFVLEDLDLYEAFGPDDERGTTATEAVNIIATSPRFASLTALRLKFNYLGNDAVETLLNSRTLSRKMWLQLWGNPYDEERYLDALSERFDFINDE